MKIPTESVKEVLNYWEEEFKKYGYSVKSKMEQLEKYMIFYTISYLEHYIELLKETGQGD